MQHFVFTLDQLHWCQYEPCSLIWTCCHHGKMGKPMGNSVFMLPSSQQQTSFTFFHKALNFLHIPSRPSLGRQVLTCSTL